MNLEIDQHLFVVGGATSGFGKAVAEALLQEKAHIVAVARKMAPLEELASRFPGRVMPVCADITLPETVQKIQGAIGDRQLQGVLINAGGPPAMGALEAKLEDWDEAYRTVLRWKIDLTMALMPRMIQGKYGRFVFVESAAVKQPIENLVLSNAMRLAVVGWIKTLSQEVARKAITLNILAPGSHATPAIERIINKKVEQTGKPPEEIRAQHIQQIGVGFMGDPADLAALAVWLLSPQSRFVTGQTISVDGGVIKGTMG